MELKTEAVTLIASSIRGQQYCNFAKDTLRHIEEYTVPQYGDYPDDQATGFSKAEIQMNLKRYVNRICTSQRGTGEQLRDCFKISHYACLLAMLIIRETISEANHHAQAVVDKLPEEVETEWNLKH